jgi:hypothetical protein
MEGTWTVHLDDGDHTIKTNLSMWNQISTSFDGNTVQTSVVLVYAGQLQHFEHNGHSFSIVMKGLGMFGHLELSMDGNPVEHDGQVARIEKHDLPPPLMQPVGETTSTETEEIIGTEDYPLDNRFGVSPLSTDREVSRQSTNELTVDIDHELGGGLNLELLTALKADISAKVSKSVESKAGEEVTERQTLHFQVPERQAVIYQVVWKRKVRSGQYLYNVNGKPVSVPYRMSHGLSCEVRTKQFVS